MAPLAVIVSGCARMAALGCVCMLYSGLAGSSRTESGRTVLLSFHPLVVSEGRLTGWPSRGIADSLLKCLVGGMVAFRDVKASVFAPAS